MSAIQNRDPRLQQQILGHILKTVDSAPLLEDPYPHFMVKSFFPTDVYAHLQSFLPDEEHYAEFSYEKHSDANGSNRKRFQMDNIWLDKLTGDQRDFWYAVRASLGSVELKQCVFNKLRKGLAYRFGCKEEAIMDQPGFALPELFRETASYYIKPHPDTRKKVVTMQISLAKDNSMQHWGTEIYRRNLNPVSWLREPRGFDIVKTMPYAPNAAYAFAVLNTVLLKSWHGRSSLESVQGTRNTILNIWYSKAEQACMDIVKDQESQQQRRKAA